VSNDVKADFRAKAAQILDLPYDDPHIDRLCHAAEDTYGAFIRTFAELYQQHERAWARVRAEYEARLENPEVTT
jgi:hypothetical protein